MAPPEFKGYVLLGIDKFRKFLVLGHENGGPGLELSLGKAGPMVTLTDDRRKNQAVLMVLKGGHSSSCWKRTARPGQRRKVGNSEDFEGQPLF